MNSKATRLSLCLFLAAVPAFLRDVAVEAAHRTPAPARRMEERQHDRE